MPSYRPEIKVLAVHHALDGKTLPEIRGLLKRDISRQSLGRWMELYKWSNAVVRDPAFYEQRGRPNKIDSDQRQFLCEMIRQRPEIYLRELRQKLVDKTGVDVTIKTLHRELTDRLNITWKRSNKRLAMRDEEARLAWIEEYQSYPAEYFVFTDESAIQLKDLQRLYGWAPAGEQAVRVINGNWGQRKSFLPAISCSGVLAMTIQDGSIKRTDFEAFLEDELLPMMNPYPDVNSILVCDNASIHGHGDIQWLCDQKGVLLVYLPAYSPDLNPIEMAFGVLKNTLRQTEALVGQEDDVEEIVTGMAWELFDRQLCKGLYENCGYAELL